MSFKIQYHELVIKEDISVLPKKDKNRIKKAIEEKLQESPGDFGKPLRRSLKGYRSLRVGDYRIVYRIEEKIVKIFIIQNRAVVYKKATIRIT